MYLSVIFPGLYYTLQTNVKKIFKNGCRSSGCNALNFFSRILRSKDLVYNSYIFPEQPFYGNYTTLDTHTNAVYKFLTRLPTRQDGVENGDKVYSNQ